MIYITIIIVAIVIAITVFGIKYLEFKNNPELYEKSDLTNATEIINDTINRCNLYNNTVGEEKYKYCISEAEIKGIMKQLAYSLNIIIIEEDE